MIFGYAERGGNIFVLQQELSDLSSRMVTAGNLFSGRQEEGLEVSE
jgi:hypothetical protein